MPPLYHRVWQYLKYKVNYTDQTIPMADGTKLVLKAGQYLTSIRNIAKGVGWYEGTKWKEPNPKTISKILEWLEKQNMISIERGNRQYTLITLLQWEKYQSKNDWGNSADLEKNDENAVWGNSEETEEKPLNQGKKDDEAVSGNSKVTVRKQPVDINKKDKECMKKEAVVVEGEEQSADFEGVPSTRDAVPTPDKGAVPQEQISKSDYEQAIRDKYLNRRGYGFDLSPDDEVALQEIMNERIPLSTVLRGIDKAFDDFKPKHSRDRIRSLKYCIPIIFDLHYAATAREKANLLLKQGGRTVHEASYQPSPEPYTHVRLWK